MAGGFVCERRMCCAGCVACDVCVLCGECGECGVCGVSGVCAVWCGRGQEQNISFVVVTRTVACCGRGLAAVLPPTASNMALAVNLRIGFVNFYLNLQTYNHTRHSLIRHRAFHIHTATWTHTHTDKPFLCVFNL